MRVIRIIAALARASTLGPEQAPLEARLALYNERKTCTGILIEQ